MKPPSRYGSAVRGRVQSIAGREPRKGLHVKVVRRSSIPRPQTRGGAQIRKERAARYLAFAQLSRGSSLLAGVEGALKS